MLHIEKIHNSYLYCLIHRKEGMLMSNNEPEIITQEGRRGVRLNYVIFPIDFRELCHALAKNGYELSPAGGRIPPPPARISYSGDIARKGETTVRFDSDSGEIGVFARSLQEVTDSFEELTKVINSELGVSLHENVRFYWCIVHYKVDTGKTPLNEIAKAENKKYIAKFSEILGKDVSSFSIRIAPKHVIPNQESWFDIAIEPDLMNAKLYHLGVVFRSPDRGKTETFVRDLENTLLKLIEVIEA